MVGRPLGLRVVDESDVRWTVAAVVRTAWGVFAFDLLWDASVVSTSCPGSPGLV